MKHPIVQAIIMGIIIGIVVEVVHGLLRKRHFYDKVTDKVDNFIDGIASPIGDLTQSLHDSFTGV